MSFKLLPKVALAVIAATTAGCSLVFDGDEFLYADAAPVDAQTLADVDPSAIVIDSITPATVDEGSGCVPADDGCGPDSRAVPIALSGSNFASDATVTLTGGGFDGQVDAIVSVAGDRLAFAIDLPVRPELGAGSSEEIVVTVAQRGFEAEQTLTLRGLDELVLPAACGDDANACDAASVSGIYSTITIDGDVRFVGDVAVELVATADVSIGGTLRVDGFAPSGQDVGGAPGPGGCVGAAHDATAPCGDGGGKAAGGGGGGGGGGNGAAGTAGGGGAAAEGAPGAAVGPTTLTPILESVGRGGGGGGQADALAGSRGGAGGGGGGVLVVRSHGRLHLGEGAGVSAAGGDGGGGSQCGALLTGRTGGGGGGSGGAILLRAGRLFVDDGSGADRLRAPGGAGGVSGANCNTGGLGGEGLIRVDAPGDAPLAALATAPALYRGPVLAPTLPPIVTESSLNVTVFGDLDTVYHVESDESEPIPVETGAGYSASANVELAPGPNRVCAMVSEAAGPATPEGIQCQDVVYIPRSSP